MLNFASLQPTLRLISLCFPSLCSSVVQVIIQHISDDSNNKSSTSNSTPAFSFLPTNYGFHRGSAIFRSLSLTENACPNVCAQLDTHWKKTLSPLLIIGWTPSTPCFLFTYVQFCISEVLSLQDQAAHTNQTAGQKGKAC